MLSNPSPTPLRSLLCLADGCNRRYILTDSPQDSLCVCGRPSRYEDLRIAIELRKLVAQVTHVSIQTLMSSRRSRIVSRSRTKGIWVIRNHTALSYPEIGLLYNKDHSTAVCAFQRIENDRKLSKAFAQDTDELLFSAYYVREQCCLK